MKAASLCVVKLLRDTTYIKAEVQHLKVLPCPVQFPLSDESDLGEAGLEHQDIATPAPQVRP